MHKKKKCNLNIVLKVVGTLRVPSISSKTHNELCYYKRYFYKSSGTWSLSLSVLMCQIIMHTPQITVCNIFLYTSITYYRDFTHDYTFFSPVGCVKFLALTSDHPLQCGGSGECLNGIGPVDLVPRPLLVRSRAIHAPLIFTMSDRFHNVTLFFRIGINILLTGTRR